MDHKPVLITEIIKTFQPKAGQVFIDCTFGAGGYSKALLKAADVEIIAVDRDPTTATYAYGMKNTKFFNTAFSKIGTLMLPLADGIMFDLGISSMQVDRPARGFSYDKDGPLDMRMGSFGSTAADFLNHAMEADIADVIFNFGEEPKAKQIAKAIVADRPMRTTKQLADIVAGIVPRIGRGHPAARTFQALRIFINDELNEVAKALPQALSLLKPGGKLVVVTFHSLEDRIVKRFMDSQVPKPTHVNKYKKKSSEEAEKPKYKLIFKKPLVPSAQEKKDNPRARSAKLRGIMRCLPSK